MISLTQARKLVAASQTDHRRSSIIRVVPLALLMLAGVLMLSDPESTGTTLLVVLAVGGLMGWTSLQARRQREALARLGAAGEAMQLQDFAAAESILVPLLGTPHRAELRGSVRTEALLMLGALAEEGHQFDAAQFVYEAVLAEEMVNPVHQCAAWIGSAGAMLRTSQLADAVDLIATLERRTLPDRLTAHVELLALYRDVVMGHADRVVESADRRRDLFRANLSTRAGYGYGLLALGFDRAGDDARARSFWHDATMLIPVDLLVHRFSEIKPLADRWAAVRNPFEPTERANKK